jgi:outer membrane protein assembly factor BamE (lipoprotein component of BamABCDE complex)
MNMKINKPHKKTSFGSYFALSLSAALILGACTPTISQRGNMLEDHQIEDVVLGIHTRTDVLRILGSPTTTAPFDDTKWYYLGQKMEKRGVLDPDVSEERIVLVSFDDQGVVQEINDLDNERVRVPIDGTKTPTQGHQTTIIQEFFGNLGKFNQSQLGGQE